MDKTTTPDDTQIAEPTTLGPTEEPTEADIAEDEGFNAYKPADAPTSRKTRKAKEEPEPSSQGDPPPAQAPDTKTVATPAEPVKEPETAKAGQDTAKARAEARAAELAKETPSQPAGTPTTPAAASGAAPSHPAPAGPPPPVVPGGGQPPPAPTGGAAPYSPGPITKEQAAEHLATLTAEHLPDRITVGDQTFDLREFAQEFPEEFNAIRVMASAIAERQVRKILEGAKPNEKDLVSQAAFDNRVSELEVAHRQQVAELNWWLDVTSSHPDARRIGASPEFNDWLAKQPPAYHRMANGNPQDAVTLLDAYKEEMSASKAAAAHDKKAGEERKRYDDLHSTTIRPGQTKASGVASQQTTEDDEEAGWKTFEAQRKAGMV